MSDEAFGTRRATTAIAQQFPEDCGEIHSMDDGRSCVDVAPDGLFAVATGIHKMGFMLSCLSAYHTKTQGSGVFYAFVKPASTPDEFEEIRVRVALEFGEPGEPGPQVQSLVDVFPAAGWHEREMYDMYGVRFEGNPDLRRMFLPDGWKGHPMRHDYAEPEQFVALKEGEDVVVATKEEGSW